MNKYEGLIILKMAPKEEQMKELLDKIQKAIEHAGGRVEKVQKMDQRMFTRPIDKQTSGFYVNYVFSAPPKTIAELDAKFHLETDVLRWQFTEAPAEQPEPKRRKAAAHVGAHD